MKKFKIIFLLVLSVLFTVALCSCGESKEGALSFKSVDGGYEVVEIDESVLEGNTLVIPSVHNGEAVVGIGERAFYNCKAIVNVEISEGVKYIGKEAFSQCSALATVKFPDSLTSIGERAFSRCYSLSFITIPENVTEIGSYAFTDTKLREVVNNSNFEWYKDLAGRYVDVIIPGSDIESHMEIKDDLIMYLPTGKKVAIVVAYTGDNTEIALPTVQGRPLEIDFRAFYERRDLKKIVIPAGVSSIGADAFYNCSSLTEIVFGGTVAEWNDIMKGSDWDTNTGSYTVKCSDGTVNK